MAKIALRAYHREIEGLIESNQSEEALAHCRYILQSFPKYLDTYRLMGKVFLENQRYGEASDVFQRVLSSVPEDFVSHVGMSIIREDEGNMDAAIWHMERAFDVQPYNSAIQGELRRLYGRRDGLEPSKVRLTRGALARMYIKGGLYQQAVAELRAALAEDAQRPDLQVLLANAYFQAVQRVEAVEACSSLLKKLPHCFEANRILACILPDTDRASDADVYRQRVISLEPYYVNLKITTPSADSVPDQAVVIDRLVWQIGQTAESIDANQPTWARNLGVSFQDKEALPEWLTEGGESEGAPEEAFSTEPTAPFTWDEAPEETTESVQMNAEELPDWMREAGWAPSDGEFQEGPVDFDTPLEEETPPATGEAVAGDMPDWLRQIAPKEILDQSGETSGELPSQEETIPWLEEAPSGSGDTVANWLDELGGETTGPATASAGAEEVPDWLQGLAPEQPEASTILPAEVSDVPDWLQGLAPEQSGGPAATTPDAAADDIPAWMQEPAPTEDQGARTGLAMNTPPVEEAAAMPGEPSAEGLSDWLQEMGTEEGLTTEAAQPAGELPDWLKEMQPEGTLQPESSEEEEAAALAWLEGIQSTPAEQTSETLPEAPSQTPLPEETPALPIQEAEIDWLQELEEPDTTAAAETTVMAEELPGWLTNLEASEPAETIQEAPAEPQAETPDWLKEFGAEETTEVALTEAADLETQATVEQTPAMEMPDLNDETAAMAWLENLAAKQGISEDELFTKPEERLEKPPAWVEQDAAQAEGKSLTAAEATTGEELPDWLAAVQAETFQEESAAKQIPSAPNSDGLPEWLLKAETEAEAVSGEIAPAETPKEIPLTSEATPGDEFPDWLLEVQSEIPADAVETSEVPIVTEGEPEWLSDAPVSGEEPSGVTGFLEEITPQSTAEESESTPDLSDEASALAWLESLAAKQGVSEEELFTSPEERAETPPAWVQAEIAQETPEAPTAENAPEPSAEGLPDWLQEVAKEAETPTEVAEAAAQEPLQTFATAEPTTSGEELPDWLSAVEADAATFELPQAETPPEPPAAEELPDWLAIGEAETAEAEASATAAMDAISDESMEALLAAISMDDLLGLEEPPAAEVSQPEVAPEVPTEAAVIEEAPITVETPIELAPVAEATAPETPVSEVAQPEPETPDLSDETAAMAWLEGLAARQGVSEEELFTKPEERAETPPAWVEKDAAQALLAEETPIQESPQAETGEELPDWLSAVEAEATAFELPQAEVTPEPPASEDRPDWLAAIEAEADAFEASQAEAPAEPTAAEELPDWLATGEAETAEAEAPATAAMDAISDESMEALLAAISMDDLLGLEEPPAAEVSQPEVAPEVPTEAAVIEEAPIAVETPVELAPVAEATTPETPVSEVAQPEPETPDLSDETAAMAWLEGLAARQGVSEEELFTKPEERVETPPAWVEKDAAQATEAAAKAEAQAPTDIPISEIEEPQEVTPEPVAEEASSEVSDAMPDWLMGIAEEVEAETTPEPVQEVPAIEEPAQEPVITQAIPDWLESIEEEAETIEEEIPEWQQAAQSPSRADLTEGTTYTTAASPESQKFEIQPLEMQTEEAPEAALDVNKASLVELEALPGIGFILAQNIINYRETYGPFNTLDDLQKVSGVGPATIVEMRQWLCVVPPQAPSRFSATSAPIGGALEEARALLSQNDPNQAAHIYGQLLRSGYPTAEILSDLQDALYRYPVDISLWQVLGEAYLLNDQLQEALEAYSKAEELLR